jgi:hypothetical protein
MPVVQCVQCVVVLEGFTPAAELEALSACFAWPRELSLA